MEEGEIGIRIKNITKSYEKKTVLDGISLEIEKGSFTTILAPTGSGKTTLLRVMIGITKPDNGKVYYNGKNVTDVPVQKRSVSMVYQQFINYPSLTIYENIASPLRVSGRKLSESEIDKKVRDNAQIVGISDLLDHLPEEVSGGEKQRTAIARALCKEPEFVFLDEPLANLDYKLREKLRGELKTILRKKQCTVIYATPEPGDALAMSTHVAFLHKGKILQFGPAQEVYWNPKYVEVASYFNEPPMNVFDCGLVIENGNYYLQVSQKLKINVNGFKNLLSEDRYLIGIRPQNLSTTKVKEGMISFKTTVEFAEIVGSDTTLHLTHQGKDLSILIEKPTRSYEIGQEIEVYLDPRSVYIYSKKSRKLIVRGQAMGSMTEI